MSVRRLLLALLALLAVTPAAGAAPTVTLDTSNATARWTQGFFKGRVTFAGTVSEPAKLFVFIRKANGRGGVLASQTIDLATPGSFEGTMNLPARPRPGPYKLRVSLVTEGGNVLQPAARDVVVPAPLEGIVDRAVVSRQRGGAGVTAVSGAVEKMWVRFRFLTPPAPGRKIKVLWFSPRADLLGTVFRTSRFVVDSFIRSPAGAIPKGNWEARLVVGTTVAKRTFVRIR